MDPVASIKPLRVHLSRLRSLWRSAGWPCRDPIELDLLAAGWAARSVDERGHETLRLTDAGLALLARARDSSRRSASAHDRLAGRVAAGLVAAGRIVWRELSLRTPVAPAEAPDASAPRPRAGELWHEGVQEHAHAGPDETAWRLARPDVYSVRRTTVEAYLHPVVHEIKVSRADLLSDLRHAAKRASYRWLSCETYYVLPAGVAEPHEIPEIFGVVLLQGSLDSGTLALARPARHVPCKLPFAVWMALAQSTPVCADAEPAQQALRDTA